MKIFDEFIMLDKKDSIKISASRLRHLKHENNKHNIINIEKKLDSHRRGLSIKLLLVINAVGHYWRPAWRLLWAP